MEDLCGIGECRTVADVLSTRASGSMVASAPPPGDYSAPAEASDMERGGLLARTTTVGGRAVVDRQSVNAALNSLKL